MTESVERFYRSTKAHIGRDTDLPDFFVYHLTVELGRPAASAQAIRECYEACDLSPPSWLASHLSNGLKSKPRRFVKKDGGYRLENQRREKIASLVGKDHGTVQTSAALNRLESLIPNGPERGFLHETILCFEAGANRAAVVMCWNLALHHLQQFVLKHALVNFNAALAANTDSRVKIKVVSKIDDFTEMPEHKFLEFCRVAKIITSTMFNKLKGRLDDRNGAAHPSGVIVAPKMAEAYIEDLIENVIQKFAL